MSHSTWHMTVSGKAEIRQRITLHPNSAFHSFLDLKSLTQLECLITLAIKTDTHKADFLFIRSECSGKGTSWHAENRSHNYCLCLLVLAPCTATLGPKKQRATGPVREGGKEKRQQRLRNWGTRREDEEKGRNREEGMRSWKCHQKLQAHGGERQREGRRGGGYEGVSLKKKSPF